MGKEYKKTPKNSKKTFPFQNKKTKQKIICAKETINAIANKKNKKVHDTFGGFWRINKADGRKHERDKW